MKKITEQILQEFDKEFTCEPINGVWTVMKREGTCGGTALDAVRQFIMEKIEKLEVIE